MEAFTLQVALSGATFSRHLSAFTQTGVEQTLEMLAGLQATSDAERSGWGKQSFRRSCDSRTSRCSGRR